MRRTHVGSHRSIRPPCRLARCWPDLAFALFLLGSIAVGAVGFLGAPSPALERVIGGSVYTYSAGVIIGSVVTIVGMVARLRRVELLATGFLALFSLIYGLIIFMSPGSEGDQTGGQIAISFFSLLALAGTRWQRGLSRHDLLRLDTLSEDE